MEKKQTDTLSRLSKEKRAKAAKKKKKELIKIKPKDLLTLLPLEEIEAIGEETGVDTQVKHLFGPMIVMLFILSILDGKDDNLRSLTAIYNSKRFSHFSGKGGHQTGKSTLADRLSNVTCEFFEKLLDHFMSKVLEKHGKALERKLGKVLRVDSTMIRLCASLTNIGMRVGAKSKKGEGMVQIKVTVGLKGLLPTTLKVFTDQAHLSEEKAMKEAIDESDINEDEVVVFDMGLKSRKTFTSFDNDDKFFVTRAKNPRYKFIRTHSQIKGRKHGDLCFESDEIVNLYQSGGGNNLCLQEFRLITAKVYKGEHSGKVLHFITNITDLPAFEIADLYQRRWDIEVFFRFLKQHIGLKNLLSTNDNGIRAVINLRVLVGTMIWVFIHLNNIKDHKRGIFLFSEGVEWELDLVKSKLIGNRTLEEAQLYLINFQGIMRKNTT